MTPRLLPPDAAAAYIGVSPSALRAMRAEGRLVPRLLGQRPRYDIRDLDAFVEALPYDDRPATDAGPAETGEERQCDEAFG